MRVTTIIPTIGRDTLWTRAVPSVMAQRTDWRCIVVGDGVHIEPFDDPRITVLRIQRPDYPADPYQRWRVLGVEAFDYGIGCVDTEWWSYLADDDAYDDSHHETLLAESAGADLVFGRSQYHWNGQLLPVRSDPPIPPGDFDVCQGAYIIRTALQHRPHTRDLVATGGWDADWWHRLRDREGIRFQRVPDVVFHYHPAPDGFGYGAAW